MSKSSGHQFWSETRSFGTLTGRSGPNGTSLRREGAEQSQGSQSLHHIWILNRQLCPTGDNYLWRCTNSSLPGEFADFKILQHLCSSDQHLSVYSVVCTFSNPITNYSYISNFVLYDDLRQVLFAVRGVIYGIRVDRQTGRRYSSLNDISCDHLQYAGNHIFYAYCTSGEAKVYNTDVEDFRNASLAIPFACPSFDESPLWSTTNWSGHCGPLQQFGL